ncbi:MAG TPA: hypothetical protein VJS13_14350 [Pyrinomonadaceae bacterium]|nr:hypothetical protein [Pyrinomonadaceae bacterium]
MKLIYSSKKVGGYILALFLIIGFTAIASSSVQAQYRNDRYRRDRDYRDDRYRRDNRYNNNYEMARQQGYSWGMNVGAADAQRGQSYNPQRSRYWKNAREGYNSSYGNRGQYQQVFRSAFEQGYREGWQRFAGNGRRNNGRWNNRWPY